MGAFCCVVEIHVQLINAPPSRPRCRRRRRKKKGRKGVELGWVPTRFLIKLDDSDSAGSAAVTRT